MWGMIRNPFDWYVSWWSSNNTGVSFKDFMMWPIEKQITPKWKMYRAVPSFFKLDGLMSSLFIFMYTNHQEFIKDGKKRGWASNFLDYNLVDEILQIEKGVKDGIADFFRANIRPLSDSEKYVLFNMVKSNRTTKWRREKTYSYFYDDDLKNLVYERDRDIFDLFGYESGVTPPAGTVELNHMGAVL
jgi:hypothetical protein